LFDLYDRDGAAISQLMQEFSDGEISFTENAMTRARALFSSHCVSDEQTREQIASTWVECEYLLDPHSAVGVRAALQSDISADTPVITLATAHPAKFPDAIKQSGLSQEVALPLHLQDLFERDERLDVVPNNLVAVQAFITANIKA
jgi:threonine synthase